MSSVEPMKAPPPSGQVGASGKPHQARYFPKRISIFSLDHGQYHDAVIAPALDRADVTILGELSEADRDALVAGSRASLVPSAGPEPFGLVVIEALACGTPVLARRVGGIPEILRDGIDGFIGDDARQLAFFDERLDGLDRAAIQAAALERFDVARMVDAYEALYARLLGT